MTISHALDTILNHARFIFHKLPSSFDHYTYPRGKHNFRQETNFRPRDALFGWGEVPLRVIITLRLLRCSWYKLAIRLKNISGSRAESLSQPVAYKK